jgi:segregation and condensation protein B
VSIGEDEAYPSIVVNEEPAAEGSQAPAEMPAVEAETEARRLSRQRDREVKAVLRQLLDELIAGSAADGRGVEIREIAGGYRMATKPECHDAVRLFVKSLKPPLKLSLPALETLAVIAYKQPVTAPEVNEIRGVESAGVLGSLLARKLIATAGRKPVIGRPILYKTTKEFLLRFGLKDVAELPSMEEFEKMATELEMEPEVTEADNAEAAQAIVGNADSEENAQADLESNSPAGEELAAIAVTAEGSEGTAAENAATMVQPANPGTAESDVAGPDSLDPESEKKVESEANFNAEEHQKES